MSKMAEILLGKEKAMERQDTLSQLEKSIEKGNRPKAQTFLKKLLAFEAQLGKAVVSSSAKFIEAERARVEKERAERKRIGDTLDRAERDVREPDAPYQPTGVFAPLTREKDELMHKRARVDSIIRELEDLKTVI